MRELFFTFSWQDLRQHPWRSLAAALAVMLGVALGLAVHLINASALTEFAQATQAINGQSDVQLRARQGLLPQRFFAAVAAQPLVARANPVLEATIQAFSEAGHEETLHLTGADALQLPATAPALMPRPWPGSARLIMLAPDALFLNASARKALHLADGPAVVQLQIGLKRAAVRVAGSVPATGQPVGVMDIGAAQDLLGSMAGSRASTCGCARARTKPHWNRRSMRIRTPPPGSCRPRRTTASRRPTSSRALTA